MIAEVLDNTIKNTFKTDEGQTISYSDTPVSYSAADKSYFFILRASSDVFFQKGDVVDFDLYLPKKQGSIVKCSQIKKTSSKTSSDIGL